MSAVHTLNWAKTQEARTFLTYQKAPFLYYFLLICCSCSSPFILHLFIQVRILFSRLLLCFLILRCAANSKMMRRWAELGEQVSARYGWNLSKIKIFKNKIFRKRNSSKTLIFENFRF